MNIPLEMLIGISLKENQEQTKRENWLQLDVGQKRFLMPKPYVLTPITKENNGEVSVFLTWSSII